MDENDDVRGALSGLLEPAPPMRLSVADHVQRGRVLRARRQGWIASGAVSVLVVGAFALIAVPRLGGNGSTSGVAGVPSTGATEPALLTSSWAPGDPSDFALIQGTLVLSTDRCVALRAPTSSAPPVPVAWPQGYTTRWMGGSKSIAEIVAADGTVVARTGQSVTFGGGSGGVSGATPGPCRPTNGTVFFIQEDLTKAAPTSNGPAEAAAFAFDKYRDGTPVPGYSSYAVSEGVLIFYIAGAVKGSVAAELDSLREKYGVVIEVKDTPFERTYMLQAFRALLPRLMKIPQYVSIGPSNDRQSVQVGYDGTLTDSMKRSFETLIGTKFPDIPVVFVPAARPIDSLAK
jgi:hypothetical protein